jgi:hypothetical protein
MERFQALIVDLEEAGDGIRRIIRRRTLPGRIDERGDRITGLEA